MTNTNRPETDKGVLSLEYATREQLDDLLLSFKEEILWQGDNSPYRTFDATHDVQAIKFALARQRLYASTTAIIERALQLNLC